MAKISSSEALHLAKNSDEFNPKEKKVPSSCETSKRTSSSNFSINLKTRDFNDDAENRNLELEALTGSCDNFDEIVDISFDHQNDRNKLASETLHPKSDNNSGKWNKVPDDEENGDLPSEVSVIDISSGENGDQPPGEQRRKHYGAGGNPPNPRIQRARFNILNIVRCNTHNPPPPDEIPYLDDKRQKVILTAKIFTLKALQMFICLELVWTFSEYEFYREVNIKYHSLAYLALFLYLVLYVTVRLASCTKKVSGSIACLLINTFCIVLISSSLYINADEYMASGMLIVLSTSYLAISLQAIMCQFEITENNNIVLTYLGLVFVLSVGALVFLLKVCPPHSGVVKPGKFVSGVFLPLWMTSECIILLQLSEVAQIILGYRLHSPQRRFDFIRAAAYLL